MKSTTIKRWFNLHKWTSLVSTAFLLMLCLTGLPLIFHEEIDHWFGNEKDAPELVKQVQKPTKDQIIENAQALKPNEVIRFVFWDEEEHPNQLYVSFADSINAPPEINHAVIMDSRTAKLLDQPETQKGFMYVMLMLHVEMFAGILGKLFLGIMGILFIIAIVSGIALYGPIMKRFDFGIIRVEKAQRLKWLDLHNLLGIVTLAWASVVGLTGVINTLADPALAFWRISELADMVAPYKNKPPIEGKLTSLDEAILTAQKAAPEMKVSFVAYPGTMFSSNHHYAVFVKGITPITSRLIKPALIDATTGSFTTMRELPWYINTILISQPFHFGDYGGLPLKIIWAIFDLATIIVLITGLYLWFARRKAKALQLARMIENNESLTLATLMQEGDNHE